VLTQGSAPQVLAQGFTFLLSQLPEPGDEVRPAPDHGH
jgi:hypothetical protein